jgi:tetratricopeptide (TPR) repeat protein
LIEQLLEFIIQPINGYEDVFGSGGKSTDDAAFAVSYLPRHIQQQAIPAICQRLKQARSFDTMPLVRTLLSAAFEKRDKPLIEITDELWSIGNLIYDFPFYGLPDNKEQCAKLVGIKITTDKALEKLSSGLCWAEMGFLQQAQEDIIKALEIDSTVFERVPTPEECWLLYAKAFAESNPKQAIRAFRRAILINPDIENRVSPTWYLADLLKEYDF